MAETMMLFSGAGTKKYLEAVREHPDMFGLFMTPRRYGIPPELKSGFTWAADNDCYNLADKFNLSNFLAWLKKFTDYRQCKFVSCPDIVGDHSQTLLRFYEIQPQIAVLGFPIAFVLQDGCNNANDIPWPLIDAVFVGGSTEYKMSQMVINLLTEAGRRGKWRHVGRVNSMVRINHFYNFADSFDGTGFSIVPDVEFRWCKNHLLWRKQQPALFEV